MSWDIILFNSNQKINSITELDDTHLEPTDFCSALENHFTHVIKSENRREIKGQDFSIDYFQDGEKVSDKMLSLYGENGLYELVVLAKKYNWQIFDTGLGQMIDLENPSNNGFENFYDYLKQILKDK
jgi:prophage antirepressor-like protein